MDCITCSQVTDFPLLPCPTSLFYYNLGRITALDDMGSVHSGTAQRLSTGLSSMPRL
jgi:hypothetical protein